MGHDSVNFDAVVIGGGPAGSTLGAILAKAGVNAAVVEKETFPRFHIGESLLPATQRIYRRLGVADQINAAFLTKPGGKWFYGDVPLGGRFDQHDGTASFRDHPNTVMAERAKFDDLLLRNAASLGASVFQPCKVLDVVRENGRVVGVATIGPDDGKTRLLGNIVFDCSGLGALISNKLKIRERNGLDRMAVFGHYECTLLDKDARAGWFVGAMLADGWVWTIPLRKNLASIGAVIDVKHYRAARKSPAEFLGHLIETTPYLREFVTPNPRLIDKVRTMGNLGYRSRRLIGDGFVLVGDAAFFIDPCYSSGVHLAMDSAEQAAEFFLDCHKRGDYSKDNFASYQERLRVDEKYVTYMVKSFYLGTRNKLVRYVTSKAVTSYTFSKFIVFIGGDFHRNRTFIFFIYWLSRFFQLLTPWWKGRLNQTH